MNNAILAVDIGAGTVKLLYGTKNKVLAKDIVDTPPQTVEDNKIIQVEPIYNLISNFISANRIKPKRISFCIYGNDLVIRHIEVPYMKEKDIQQTVEWEIGRNLPNAGANYYIDYEILNCKEGKKEKVYQILAAAVLKERIDAYLQLADVLDLKVCAIDIKANCTARVFKQFVQGKNEIKNIGIIDIGKNTTTFTIVDKRRLAIERQIPLGVEQLMNEVTKSNPDLKELEFQYIQHSFSHSNTTNETDIRISQMLENIVISFQKVVQFYTTGKLEKLISYIIVIGAGGSIYNIEELIKNYFPVTSVLQINDAKFKRKSRIFKDLDLQYYTNTLGLLLRED